MHWSSFLRVEWSEINKNSFEHASTQKTSHFIKELGMHRLSKASNRAIYPANVYCWKESFCRFFPAVITRPEYEGGNFNRSYGLMIIHVTRKALSTSFFTPLQSPWMGNGAQRKMNCICQNSIQWKFPSCITCINNAMEMAKIFLCSHFAELCFVVKSSKMCIEQIS